MRKIFCLLFIPIFLASCVSRKKQTIKDNILILRDSYCKAPFHYNYSNKIPSYNSDSIISANAALKKDFSDQSILILNALGNLDEIQKIVQLKADTSLRAKLKMLQLKNVVNNKITISLTELDAVAAEFDCEGERVAQMANYVDNLNSDRNNRFVTYSIIAGAAASIASGIIRSNSLGNAIDIGGGVIGAGLGFVTLKPKGKKVEFVHDRNLLRDVWNEKLESPNFPPFVWYMYTEKRFASYADSLSILQNIKKRWLQFNFNNDINAANASVLFNSGGVYRSEDLHNRESMLNQMQSATRTINQSINYLLLDLDRFILLE
ncbi:hypothetical protein [Sphingobacterium sp. MYb382]|uniref:hypothetical protein n=1 Tax=Sphingobacterium sp. MYb382 TaxID=2745278 RepID=UPI0030A448AA